MKLLRKFFSAVERIEQKVGTAALMLMGLMIIGKGAGFLKLHFIARFFGISKELDVFWAAFAFPDLIFALLVVGTVNAALIPVFIKIINKENKQVLAETLNTVLGTLIILLLIFAGVFYFATPYIARFLFSSQDAVGIIQLDPALSQGTRTYYINLFINLSRLMLASPFILTISSVLGAYLQSHKKFLSAALAPVFYNVGMVSGIVFFATFAPQFGIYALGYSVILGSVLHLLVQIPAVLQLHPPTYLQLKFNKYVKDIFKLSVPRIFGLGVEQIASVFNTFWSFTLGAGALSAFAFAKSLHSLPVDLITGSFLQAIFPRMNEAANKDDDGKSLKNLYLRSLVLVLLIAVPVVILTIVLRIALVRLAYGAGRFSWSATVATSFVLAFFAPAILLQALASLNIRTFYSIHNTKTPLLISIVGMISAIGCSVLFTNFFSHYHDFRDLWVMFWQNPIQFDFSRLLVMLNWFSVRNQSFAAVAGLAFGLSVGLLFEVALSFFLLSRNLKLGAFLKDNTKFIHHIKTIIIAGLLVLATSYLFYKTFDTYVLDSAYILQLVLLSLFVASFIMGIYIFLTKDVFLTYINTEKIKRNFSNLTTIFRGKPIEK